MNLLESVVEPPEIVEVEANVGTVACDGGGGALGHPVVYLTFSSKDYTDCYYCGRRFVRIQNVQKPIDD